MDPGLDRLPVVLGDGEQLDGVAQLAGEGDVDRLDPADAFRGDVGEPRPHTERERGQDGELVGGVDAVDVGGRVGLGEPEPLRLTQHVVEAPSLPGHGGENVIARAVDDSVDRRGPVAGQSLRQGPQDRDATAHAGLEAEPYAGLLRRRHDLLAVHGEQSLVRRHDVLAATDRLEHEAPRRLVAADELQHDVDVGIGQQAAGIPRQPDAAGRNATLRVEIEVGDGRHDDRPSRAPCDLRPMRAQQLHHPGADRAKADQPDPRGPYRR